MHVEVRDLSRRYGEREVLRGVDLDLAPGDFVAIAGMSGSGKTTLLNVLGGLDRAYAGSVRLDGKEVRTLRERELARLRNERIGFVFQLFHLLEHLTVLENVTLPARFARNRSDGVRDRARALLERVGLGEMAERMPATLSGGQKQRVAIARALLHDPSLLLCDEPTGSLDRDTGDRILTLFEELRDEHGLTLVVVTHEEPIAERAERIVRIEDGVIREPGGTEALHAPEGRTGR